MNPVRVVLKKGVYFPPLRFFAAGHKGGETRLPFTLDASHLGDEERTTPW